MKVDITALNLLTIDCIYSELDRLPGLGEEISTPHLRLALGGGPQRPWWPHPGWAPGSGWQPA